MLKSRIISSIFLTSLLSTKIIALEAPAYVGFDVQNCHIHFDTNFGGNLLKRDMQGANPFFGVKLNEVFSVEFGYQHISSTKTTTLPAGSYAAGTYVHIVISPITLKSTATFKSTNVNLIASTRVFSFLPVQFFGGLGISHTTAIFTRRTMQYDGVIGTVKRRMGISHSIPCLTVGANYFLTKNFSFRGSLIGMRTKKLHAFANDGHDPAIFWPEIRTRNSICYSLGIRWNF